MRRILLCIFLMAILAPAQGGGKFDNYCLGQNGCHVTVKGDWFKIGTGDRSFGRYGSLYMCTSVACEDLAHNTDIATEPQNDFFKICRHQWLSPGDTCLGCIYRSHYYVRVEIHDGTVIHHANGSVSCFFSSEPRDGEVPICSDTVWQGEGCDQTPNNCFPEDYYKCF